MGATMNGILTMPSKVNLGQRTRTRRSFRQIREDGPMIGQFVEHMKRRDSRKMFFTILAGKLIAVALIFGLVKFGLWFLGNVAFAQDAATPAAPNLTLDAADAAVSGVNTAWTLIAAFLVFFMQAGFMMLEA